MNIWALIFWLLGWWPLGVAWWRLWSTSLCHALGWAAIAWLASGAALLFEPQPSPGWSVYRYTSLCLMGATAVAVLGARRPHVEAWNFVLLGLLGVMFLPVFESWILRTNPADPLRILFLTATLVAGILNYISWLHFPANLVFAVFCGWEIVRLYELNETVSAANVPIGEISLLSVPWLMLGRLQSLRPERYEVNRIWRDFRVRYGMFWSLRVREQFNNSLRHAGIAVELAWHGIEGAAAASFDPALDAELSRILRATLKRFLPE